MLKIQQLVRTNTVTKAGNQITKFKKKNTLQKFSKYYIMEITFWNMSEGTVFEEMCSKTDVDICFFVFG